MDLDALHCLCTERGGLELHRAGSARMWNCEQPVCVCAQSWLLCVWQSVALTRPAIGTQRNVPASNGKRVISIGSPSRGAAEKGWHAEGSPGPRKLIQP